VSDDYGLVEIQAEYDDGNPVMARTRILRADPRVRISPELLDQATGDSVPGMTVTGDRLDVVTISDSYGQRFIYRLGEYDALTDTFGMEWPDR
jgi:hypothetical protein